MTLPEAFERRMKAWLGPEWMAFREALTEAPPVRGVRLQRFSVDADARSSRFVPTGVQYALQSALGDVPSDIRHAFEAPVPWSADSYYISSDSTLGKRIYHEIGSYYLQEPSAMAVVTALDPQAGEKILDLCAAPGGKTTAISKRMQATGVLVANEIHPVRVLTLAQNLERTGVPAIVTNESPQRLAQALPGYFDAVLVDAPCSGEGMFRKDPSSRAEWTADSPEKCAERQREIFAQAVRLTRNGGRIVYSTCTFNAVEDERIVQWALKQFPLQLLPLPHWDGWESGRSDWADDTTDLSMTRRLWPHKAPGEGHFVAAFRVESSAHHPTLSFTTSRPTVDPLWQDWLQPMITGDIPSEWQHPIVRGALLFARGELDVTALKLRVLRPGLCLAQQQNGRFEPHHSFAMAAATEKIRNCVVLDNGQAADYLAGQALEEAPTRGFVRLHLNGLPLGWGKSVPGRINNLYPKGLRKPGLH